MKRILRNQIMANMETTKLHKRKRREIEAMMLPIYSRTSGCWQMDTLEQSDDMKLLHKEFRGNSNAAQRIFNEKLQSQYFPYYLILINVNTREAFAWAMKHKNADAVRHVLEEKFLPNHECTKLYTDEDMAYKNLAPFFETKNIAHVTTNSDNHHTLGIINRFIRGLRDEYHHRRDLSWEEIHRYILKYNSRKHSSTGVAPEKMTTAQEREYIMDKYQRTQAIKAATLIPSNQPVRIALDHTLFEKRRLNFTQDAGMPLAKGKAYEVKYGTQTLRVPRWKLHPGGRIQKDDEILKILDYDWRKNMYKVAYTDNSVHYIGIDRLRTEVDKLHELERAFWKGTPLEEMPMPVRLLWKQRIKLVL